MVQVVQQEAGLERVCKLDPVACALALGDSGMTAYRVA